MTTFVTQQLLAALDGRAAPEQIGQPPRDWIADLTVHQQRESAVANQPALDEFRVNQADSARRFAGEMQDAAHAERGRQLLHPPASGQYPPALVASAQAAIAAETAAHRALVDATRLAQQWYDKHGVASAALGDQHTEARTADADASAAASQACAALGAAAERIDQARAVLAAETQRRRAADQAWQHADDQITRDLKDARAVLAGLGV